jgi:Rha family phage regulatory protein
MVSLAEGRPVVSSLAVAEHFGKQHYHVLDSIRGLFTDCPADFNASNFRCVEYTDAKGQVRPAYNLTRDGFTLLVMGFTGKKALAWKLRYIEAFNAMEEELKRLGHNAAEPEALRSSLPEQPSPEVAAAQRGIRTTARVTLVNVSLQLAKLEGGGSAEMWEHYVRLCRLVTAGVVPHSSLARELTSIGRAEEAAKQVGEWVTARLEASERGIIQCKYLYADFVAWCELRGERPSTLPAFGLVMKEMFQRIESNVIYYRGLQFKEAEP